MPTKRDALRLFLTYFTALTTGRYVAPKLVGPQYRKMYTALNLILASHKLSVEEFMELVQFTYHFELLGDDDAPYGNLKAYNKVVRHYREWKRSLPQSDDLLEQLMEDHPASISALDLVLLEDSRDYVS